MKIGTLTDIKNQEVKLLFSDSGKAKRITPAGIDSLPPKDTKALVATLENNNQDKVYIGILEKPTVKEGETKIFNDFDAEIYLKDNGEIVFNKGADYLVSMGEMQDKINELVDSVNNVISVINANEQKLLASLETGANASGIVEYTVPYLPENIVDVLKPTLQGIEKLRVKKN